MIGTPLCHRCLAAPGTVRHHVYECYFRHEWDSQHDEHIVTKALSGGIDSCPAYYLRGTMLHPRLPHLSPVPDFRAEIGVLPETAEYLRGAVIGTDGSGGPYVGPLQRSAYAWVLLDRMQHLQYAVIGTVVGDRSTVPRAEFTAITDSINTIAPVVSALGPRVGYSITYSDHLRAVSICQSYQASKRAANYDLIRDLKAAASQCEGIQVMKVKLTRPYLAWKRTSAWECPLRLS